MEIVFRFIICNRSKKYSDALFIHASLYDN